MRFQATIELGGKTATGFRVPVEVVESLGAGKKPPVRVTIADYTYRSTIAPRGDRFLVPLSAENRTNAGVAAGDQVEIELTLDTEPREVLVPADFAQALAGDPRALETFDGLSYSRRQWFVLGIEQAKTEQTRERRIGKAIDTLLEA